jgi:hypothetical protein
MRSISNIVGVRVGVGVGLSVGSLRCNGDCCGGARANVSCGQAL